MFRVKTKDGQIHEFDTLEEMIVTIVSTFGTHDIVKCIYRDPSQKDFVGEVWVR
jgi:hypothetical protein